jgi:L-threonylcarbamoyladenylate synthase
MVRLDGHDAQAVARAAKVLADGGLVAFPTETVYGLGARADDDAAVAAIFAAKGRPGDHPLIVHVTDAQAAQTFAREWPPLAQRLADAFWPGPLTLIVQRSPARAQAAAGGHDTIGLRSPAHPVARALLAEAARLGVNGVAAPSANRFGRVSPTCADHVEAEFASADTAIVVLDGGNCELGIESAIVDVSRGSPVLLRPGVLTRAQIEAAAGQALVDADAAAPRASGTLEAHYAPRARVRLMDAKPLQAALAMLREAGGAKASKVAVYSRTVAPGPGFAHRVMASDAAGAAQELFRVLRELDDAGVSLIWVESPPASAEWDGVRDRLQRAAAA